jgi:Zn-dependent protease/CBS domain-containing protein
MGRSLKLLTIRGIDIRVHFTFPLILLWAALQFGLVSGSLSGAWLGVVVILLLFVLVTLHELGHSFAALRYGVVVEQIMLSPIGGVAQLQRMPEKPIQEFVIALAGPAVNLAAALVMALFIPLLNLTAVDFATVLSSGAGLTGTAVFVYVFVYNIFLAVFNLIPAFPLDGGRIFRALLAMRLDYVRATNIAATVGRVSAIFLGIYALFNGGIFLIFIAFFIYMAAGQEASYVRQRGALQGFHVRDIFSPSAYTVTPYTTLQQAVNLMMISGQGSFPVVQDERLEGFITQRDLSHAMQTRGAHAWANMIMRRNVAPVTPSMPILDVQERLHEEQLDALPVVENGRYAGLIGRWQINQLLRWKSINGHFHPQSA